MFYTVNVFDGEVEHVHKYYGLIPAVEFCTKCGLCDNVTRATVIDCDTGEIMFEMENQIVVWVSGIGNPCEI